MRAQLVVTLGVHVLDVLVRPVEEIPEGQGATLVEDIRMTAAGTAAGTALTLAKLGASVRTSGAIGTDPTGDLLIQLLDRAGIDTELLVRRTDTSTSATVLPIRPNGDRPTLHLLGANITYGLDDVPWDAIAEASHLHLGGPELMGAEVAARILAHAREHDVVTSVDLLAPGELGTYDQIEPLLPYVDFLLPNDDQVLGFSEEQDLVTGARKFLAAGAGLVAVTRGGDGALLVTPDGTDTVPAFDVDVVDTTGCGDAFSAGFLRGIGLGRTPREAAVLGSAAAALVAQGLGTDHGDFDLPEADEFAMTHKTRT
ncbi:carbohydrate kinase family protein [Streptomyces spinosirectus]|jgi:sugar/nucleoside kinase (ribokinase family)|uniref:carbohydrate kinase family protein n=1 Tax=Streptomyces TaxID=1883 RepID=UPI000D34E4CA|nr:MULTISPECIES: carbohydrate kinase family protein [Streptomyces]MBY8338452.1 carbohydrate kinase family protein [Streptomyces plumbidurans]PTM96771.1 sugar/nucleoside kinase (ribokinase family) [Streptomyces sp. VMFN-G11Ma]UIR16339.1 carbohydrate kinase family protein [Streptomyces spinosirectus]